MTASSARNARTLLAGLIIIALSCSFPATAATLVVTSNGNTGAGTLRQAIADATNGDAIQFNLSGGSETIVIGSELSITKTLTIDGTNTAGSGVAITIRVTTPGAGGTASRIFNINAPGKTVSLAQMTLRGGDVSALGGASAYGGTLYVSAGSLLASRVTIEQSKAGSGGGVYADGAGPVVFTECSISSCQASIGAGIYSAADYLRLVGCTISSNVSSNYGGGLYHTKGSSLVEVQNCTIAGNTCTQIGAGIRNRDGTFYVVDTTITGNSTTNDGGGFAAYTGTYSYLLNTIVINNSAPSGGDISNSGTMEARYCWYHDTSGSVPSARCVSTAYNASHLDALGDYGGPTQTVKVNSNAPAYTTGGAMTYYNPTDGYYYYDESLEVYVKPAGGAVFTPSDPDSDIIDVDQRGSARVDVQTMGAYHLFVETFHAELHGPASQFKDSPTIFTVKCVNNIDVVSAVDQDTVFDLSSDSSGTVGFYSDVACTTAITQVTIPNGSSSATFYYRDDTYGDATLTAAYAGGMSLGDATATSRVRGNNAVKLDGTDDYIAADDVCAALNYPSAMTLECWIYPTSVSGDVYFLAFNDSDKSNNIQLGISSTGVLKLMCDNATTNGSTLTANQWYHVALTIAADNSAVVYLDGVSNITQTTTERPATNGYFSIGQEWDVGGPSNYAVGFIDEVRVWNVARSRDQIRAGMYRPLAGNEAGLVAYYKLDNGTGTTAYDSAGIADGTLTNGVAWVTSGAFSGPGNALEFNGASQGVLVPDFPKSSDVVTVEAWVYCANAAASWATVAKNWGTNVTGQFLFGLESTAGIMGSYITQSNGTSVYIHEDPSGPTFPENEWAHVALVADGSYVRLYRNGLETATPVAYDGTLKTTFGPLGVGVKPNNAGTDFAPPGSNPGYWNGRIDEFRIWSTARTAAQIRDNMCRSLNGDEAGLALYYRCDQTAAANQTKLFDQTSHGNNGTLGNMDPATDWVASTAFVTWIGAADSTWNTQANWSRSLGGSPWTTGTDNVGIPSYANSIAYPNANTPDISGTVTAGIFTLATDAAATLTGDITIESNCFLNDDIDFGSRDVVVGGSLITSGTITAAGASLRVDGDFDSANGGVTAGGSSEIYFKGDCSLGASFTSSGLASFIGSAAQTMTGGPTFYDLFVSNDVNASSCTSLKVNHMLLVDGAGFTGAGDWTSVRTMSDATLALSDNITVSGDWNNAGTFTHNDHSVTLDGSNQELSGATSFHTLIKSVTTADTLMFPSSGTVITDSLTLQGAAGQLLSLRGPSPSADWQITPPDPDIGLATLQYLNVADSQVLTYRPLDVDGYHCVDAGGNDGWLFGHAAAETLGVSEIKTTTAKVRCTLTDIGDPIVTQHGVAWKVVSASSKTKEERTTDGVPSATGEYVSVMTGLQPSTTYSAYAYAGSDWYITYGSAIQFTTPATDPAPDLHVTVTTTQSRADVGDPIDFDVDVENRGTATASNVTLRFPLPSGTEFVSASLEEDKSSNQASIFRAYVEGDEIVVVVGDVVASGSLKVNIILRTIAAGSVTLSGVASCTESSTPESVDATANVVIGDVYYVVTRGPLFGVCGLFGSMLPLMMTFALLAFVRRSRHG